MAIIGIVAIAKNFSIGKDGKLPWHYSADLKHFKQTTTGHAIVMGSNTWRSLHKPLPNRLNIVLSRSAQIDAAENLIFLRSKEETVNLSKFLKCDLFVIGGAKTYAEFTDVIGRWIVTEIPMSVENADTFMPVDFLRGFSLSQTIHIGDELSVKKFDRA